MLEANIDGRLQVTAAASLLDFSQLVHWDRNDDKFVAISEPVFEEYWKTTIDPVFGRIICWGNFSTGAEFLAKGVCLLNGIEFRDDTKRTYDYPDSSVPSSTWAYEFWTTPRNYETIPYVNYGTLGDLYSGRYEPLKKLLKQPDKKAHYELILASYKLLTKTIRNRDAHAYCPNVRSFHHNLVAELFVECFNLLVSWLPGGAGTLNGWRDQAADFVARC